MRTIIRKKNSTKAERRLAEQLKVNHIPFRHRVKIGKYECDFVINNLVVEIGNHKGNSEKNKYILENGYHLYTFGNKDISQCIELIKKWLCQEQKQQM